MAGFRPIGTAQTIRIVCSLSSSRKQITEIKGEGIARPEVSALRILTLAKYKILNIALRATVSDKNVKCKQAKTV